MGKRIECEQLCTFQFIDCFHLTSRYFDIKINKNIYYFYGGFIRYKGKEKNEHINHRRNHDYIECMVGNNGINV